MKNFSLSGPDPPLKNSLARRNENHSHFPACTGDWVNHITRQMSTVSKVSAIDSAYGLDILRDADVNAFYSLVSMHVWRRLERLWTGKDQANGDLSTFHALLSKLARWDKPIVEYEEDQMVRYLTKHAGVTDARSSLDQLWIMTVKLQVRDQTRKRTDRPRDVDISRVRAVIKQVPWSQFLGSLYNNIVEHPAVRSASIFSQTERDRELVFVKAFTVALNNSFQITGWEVRNADRVAAATEAVSDKHKAGDDDDEDESEPDEPSASDDDDDDDDESLDSDSGNLLNTKGFDHVGVDDSVSQAPDAPAAPGSAVKTKPLPTPPTAPAAVADPPAITPRLPSVVGGKSASGKSHVSAAGSVASSASKARVLAAKNGAVPPLLPPKRITTVLVKKPVVESPSEDDESDDDESDDESENDDSKKHKKSSKRKKSKDDDDDDDDESGDDDDDTD